MQVTDKVTLNLSGEELFAPIFARQGDLNSRIVEATLQFDEALYEIPENTKVVVTYRSANGKSDIHDGAVSGANTVTFPLIPLLLSAPGRARCDVELYNSGDMLGTGLLYVDVTPIAAKIGSLEASPEYQTFVDAIADMTNKTADADEAINNANTATEAANTAAQNAAEKATAAQAAADAANTATGAANTAAGAANTAAGSANSAATRATTAAEEAERVIADVSGELGDIVDTQISGQKGQPNGIASLDSSGKLAQMPTAADVGASYNSATIVLADTSQSYDLNDYWTPGQLVYVSQSVIDNKSIANCPSTTGGLLEVIGSSQNLIIQQYTAVGDGLLYTRHKAITSGNISGWGGVNGIITETNSNGTYVKYPDGTMICFGSFATGSCPPGQIIGTQSRNYPVAFVGTPVMTLLARADTTTGTALAYLGSNTSGAWWGYAQNNTDTARAISIHWTAIGRWK